MIDLNNPEFVAPWSPRAEWKRELIRHLAKRFKLWRFVETGTCWGDTVAAVRDCFSQVYSIELSHVYHESAKLRFALDENVHLIFGDSAEELERLLTGFIDDETLFWIDAHVTGGEDSADAGDPIPKEIRAIAKYQPRALVLVDDIHPEYVDWPSFAFLKEAGCPWRARFLNGVLILDQGGYDLPEKF